MPAGGPRDPDTTQAKAALKDADIIVIPAGIPRTYCPNYKPLIPRREKLTSCNRQAWHEP